MTVRDDTTGHDAPFTGSGGEGLPVADAAGMTVDTTTYDNPITGDGKVTTLVFAADTTVLALAIEGDAYPRVLFGADPDGYGVVMFGDGTINPTQGAGLSLSVVGTRQDLVLRGSGAGGGGVRPIGDMSWFTHSQGPVLRSPGATPYRIVVDDDGVLSTVDTTVIFADAFGRADGPLGEPWFAQFDPYTDDEGFAVIGGQAGCPDVNPRASTVSAAADCIVSVDVPVVPIVPGGVALVTRFQDTDNHVRLLMTGAVQEVVAGVATTLGTLAGGAVADGDRVRILVQDANVFVYRNGAQEMNGTLAEPGTGTQCGLLSIGDDTARFDNFDIRTV